MLRGSPFLRHASMNPLFIWSTTSLWSSSSDIFVLFFVINKFAIEFILLQKLWEDKAPSWQPGFLHIGISSSTLSCFISTVVARLKMAIERKKFYTLSKFWIYCCCNNLMTRQWDMIILINSERRAIQLFKPT